MLLHGRDGELFSALPSPRPLQQRLLFLSLGLVCSGRAHSSSWWVISWLVLHAREAGAQVSKQQEQWGGMKGERVWGGEEPPGYK